MIAEQNASFVKKQSIRLCLNSLMNDFTSPTACISQKEGERCLNYFQGEREMGGINLMWEKTGEMQREKMKVGERFG